MDGIVSSVLNTVLSKYVKKFDSNSIDLSVWKGEAILTDVEIKPSALDFLNLPINIRIGFAGRILLQVDWKRLGSKPARIELSDIRIVCGPRSHFEITDEMEEEEKKANETTKQQMMNTWEQLMLVPQEDCESTKNKPDSSYTKRMLEKVLDNIHVVINNVHIRYEDNVQKRNFAFGISIRSLSALTTNEHWQPDFINQTTQYVRKLVKLQDFCVYLNTRAGIATDEYLANYFSFNDQLGTIFDGQDSRQYIVRPTSLELKVTMNKNASKDNYEIPQILILGSMKQLSLSLGQDQFTDLLAILSNITIAASYGKYLCYRPKNTTPRESPKIFWKWAINCIKRDQKQERNLRWRKFLFFTRDRSTYISLYIRKLNAMWMSELQPRELNTLKKYEEMYDYNDILYFRRCAVAQMRVHLNNQPVLLRKNMPKPSSKIFSGWFGSKKKRKARKAAEVAQLQPISMTLVQKYALYFKVGCNDEIEFIDDQSDDISITMYTESDDQSCNTNNNTADMPKDFIRIRFKFELKSAELSLLDILENSEQKPQSILGCIFDSMNVDVHIRPESSILMRAQLQNMTLIDHFSQNMITQSMIQRSDVMANPRLLQSINDLPALMALEFELNPLDKIADSKVLLRTQPITADLHIPVFLRLGSFFVQERPVDMHAFERAALLQLEALQKSGQAALADAVAFHKTMYVDVELFGPRIMLRENPSDPKSTVLIVNLGLCSISSNLQKNNASKGYDEVKNEHEIDLQSMKNETSAMHVLQEREKLIAYYDSFVLTVSDIKIFLDVDEASNHILTPLTLTQNIHSCVFPSENSLPTIVLEGNIPKVDFKLTSSNMRKLYFMIENLLLDTYQEMEVQADYRSEREARIKHMSTYDEEKNNEEYANDVSMSSSDMLLNLGQKREVAEIGISEVEADQQYFDERAKIKIATKVNILIAMTIDNIQFSLVDNVGAKRMRPETVIVSYLRGTSFYMSQMKWDLSMQISIRDIGIEDHLCSVEFAKISKMGDVPYLLTTSSFIPDADQTEEFVANKNVANSFIQTNIKIINNQSPNYTNASMTVDVSAGDIILYLRPETIYSLTEICLTNFLPPAADGKRKRKRSKSVSTSVQGNTQKRIDREKKRKDKIRKLKTQQKEKIIDEIEDGTIDRTSKINILITINFSSLQLYVCAKYFNIAHAEISGFNTDIKIYPFSMDLNISLKNILLTDTTFVADLYPTIMEYMKDDGTYDTTVEPLENTLVMVNISMYNKKEIQYPGYNMKLDVKLQCFKFVFLKRFTDEFIKWLMHSALLKIPHMITEIVDNSELMGSTLVTTTVADTDIKSVAAAIPEHNEVQFKAKSLTPAPVHSQLPQLKITVSKLRVVIPSASTSKDCIIGNLGELIVENNVLENDHMLITIKNAKITTEMYKISPQPQQPLFHQSLINVRLSDEFRNVQIIFETICLQLAYKQYEFIMHMLAGNLSEKAQVATRVYPQRQIDLHDIINEVQQEKIKNVAQEVGKQRLKKTMSLELKIDKLEANLLKLYGNNVEDALVQFMLSGMSLNVDIDEHNLEICLCMKDMKLRDTSIDTSKNNVQIVYRDLLAFNLDVKIEDANTSMYATHMLKAPVVEDDSEIIAIEDDEYDKHALNIAIDNKYEQNTGGYGLEDVNEDIILSADGSSVLPFIVGVKLNHINNEIEVDVKLKGLQFTFGSVIWTLQQFAIVEPACFKKLPKVPKELIDYQLQMMRDGRDMVVEVENSSRKLVRSPVKGIQSDVDEEVANTNEIKDDDSDGGDQYVGPPLNLKVIVSVTETMVKLVRYPTKRYSSALVFSLEVGATVIINEDIPLSINARVDDVQAYQATIEVVDDKNLIIHVRDGVPKIMEPFNIDLGIDQYQSKLDLRMDAKSTGMRGTIGMTPLSIRFGYRDFDLLMNSLNAVKPPELVPTDDQFVCENDEKASPQKNVNNKDDEKLKKNKKQWNFNQSSVLKNFGEMEFEIAIGNLYLELVNDAAENSSIPVARIVIHDIRACLDSYQQRMSIAAGFGLYADYFNMKIVEWEPMVEKWKMNIRLIFNPECMFVQLLPTRVFNVSVTHGMITSLMKSIEMLTEKDLIVTDDEIKDDEEKMNNTMISSSTKIRRHRSSSTGMPTNLKSLLNTPTHVLNNFTEFRIQMKKWQSPDLTESQQLQMIETIDKFCPNIQITEEVTVEADAGQAFFGWPNIVEKVAKKKCGFELFIISDESEWESFTITNCNHIQERTYFLSNTSTTYNNLILCVSIELIGGQKAINVHSPIEFINECDFNLLLFEGTICIERRSAYFCPVRKFANDLQFDLQPQNKKNTTFKPVTLLPLSPYKEGYSYDVNIHRSDGVIYSMLLHTKKASTGERVQFIITSKLQIENLLICDLGLTFLQNGREENINIKPGEIRSAYGALKGKMICATLLEKNLEWNGKQLLMEEHVKRAMKKLKFANQLKNIDNDNSGIGKKYTIRLEFEDKRYQTKLCVICDFTHSNIVGCLKLTFYCPYWIYDLTTLDLMPSEDKLTVVAGKADCIFVDKKAEEVEPMMFNFSEKGKRSKISVRAHSYPRFSRSFTPDAIGSYGRINELYGKHPTKSQLKYEYEVGIDINLVLGPFRGLIRKITLVPRIILKNEFDDGSTLYVRQIHSQNVPQKYCEPFIVAQNKTTPFWWIIRKEDVHYKRRMIQFRKSTHGSLWSAFLPIDSVKDFTISVRSAIPDASPELINVCITSNGTATYVIFKKADYEYPPYKIENRTLTTRFRFSQRNINLWQVVNPLSIVPYGWDDPTRDEKDLQVVVNLLDTNDSYLYDLDNTEIVYEDIWTYAMNVENVSGLKPITIDNNNRRNSRSKKSKRRSSSGNDNLRTIQLHIAVQMFGPTKSLIISDFPIGSQESLSVFQFSRVNYAKIFRCGDAIVKNRMNVLKDSIVQIDKEILHKKNKQRSLKRGSSPKKGEVKKLIVQVIEARNLVESGFFTGKANPYLQMAVHSRRSLKTKKPKHFATTETRNGTRNPMWNQKFEFEGQASDFFAIGINVQDKGTFSDTFMGGATMMLSELHVKPGETFDQWVKLKGTQQTSEVKNGDVHLQITFAQSESAAIEIEIGKLREKRSVYHEVECRTMKEMTRRQMLDPDKIPKQKQHRIIVRCIHNYKSYFDTNCHKIYLVVRFGNESRKMSLDDHLFENVSLMEDFFIAQDARIESFYIELWLKTIAVQVKRKQSEKKDADGDIINDEVVQFSIESAIGDTQYIGSFIMPHKMSKRVRLGSEEKKENDSSADDSESSKPDNTQCEQLEKQFHILKFHTKHQTLQNLTLEAAWTERLAKISSLRSNINIKINIPDIGLSIVDGTPRELLYISTHDIDILLKKSIEQTTIQLSIDSLQIDVQKYSARYCSLLAPAPQPPASRKPFLYVSLNIANILDVKNLIVIQFFSILLQKMEISLDEKIIWDLVSFGQEFISKSKPEYSIQYSRKQILYNSKQYLEIVPSPPMKFFFKCLLLQPLAIDISIFVDSTSRPKNSSSNPLISIICLFVNSIINTIGDLDAVGIRLNALGIDNAFGDFSTLFVPIIQHYRNEGLKEAYKFIGGMELLGNPVKLITNLGTGVTEFFVEPAKGLMKSPEAFAHGLGKGTSSLVTSVVGGIFGSASKITGTIGKGVEVLTLDEDFQANRRIKAMQNRPKNVAEGLAKGMFGLGKGIFDGVTGLVVQPVKGMKQGGISGAGKGVIKGLTGLVFKPVVGVLDLTTNTLQGIGNSTDFLDRSKLPPVERRRLPRSLQKNKKLRPYKSKEALGSLILWHMEEKGLDAKQKQNLTGTDLIALRERERILFQEIINSGERIVCGTDYRFFAASILKRKQFSENTSKQEFIHIHSIWKAYYGIKVSVRSNDQKDIDLRSKYCINVTDIVQKEFNKTKSMHKLNVQSFLPMNEIFGGDPAPKRKKYLQIIYTPSENISKSGLASVISGLSKSVVSSLEASPRPTHDSDRKSFMCLFSSRCIKSVRKEIDSENSTYRVIVDYYRYVNKGSPLSAITNVTVNLFETDNGAIDFSSVTNYNFNCDSEREVNRLYRKIDKYIERTNPKILYAQLGYANIQENVTLPMKEMVEMRNQRDLLKVGSGKPPDFTRVLLGRKYRENSEMVEQGFTKNLLVMYSNHNGNRTKMFKDKTSVDLD